MTAHGEIDTRFMQLAVRMAERGLGATAPNPSVGAVLVRFDADPAGVVVGRGWTQAGGRPHAETEALRAAGAAARGATLYVTLEPCSHHGKTPPCAEAVIAAGVARVVAGIEDPDVRVSGRGLAMLRAASVEVETGVEAAACRWVTLGHILRVTERRPMVTIKMALQYNRAVPRGHQGQPTFATGPEARAAGHLLRAAADAILIGSQTVLDDDPELTCRLPGLFGRSPIRIVLDGTLRRLTPETRLARSARDVPVWAIASPEALTERREALAALGVRVFVSPSAMGRPKVEQVLELLADEGITRLLVEGGHKIWTAFVRSCFVDEATIFIQPYRISPKAGPHPSTFPELSRIEPGPAMIVRERGHIGVDEYFRFERSDA